MLMSMHNEGDIVIRESCNMKNWIKCIGALFVWYGALFEMVLVHMVRCLILYSVLVLMHGAHVRLLRGSFMKCHSFDCSYGSEL